MVAMQFGMYVWMDPSMYVSTYQYECIKASDLGTKNLCKFGNDKTGVVAVIGGGASGSHVCLHCRFSSPVAFSFCYHHHAVYFSDDVWVV